MFVLSFYTRCRFAYVCIFYVLGKNLSLKIFPYWLEHTRFAYDPVIETNFSLYRQNFDLA